MTEVFIFLGQSNMQGQTERLSESEPVENAVEYRAVTNEFAPLKNPVGEYLDENCQPILLTPEQIRDEVNIDNLSVLAASFKGTTNMVPSFARAYLAERKTNFVAVHAARGSSVISKWIPGTIGYGAIVKKTKMALSAIHDEIGGVYAVWLQGESDTLIGTKKDAYLEALNSIIDALKKDVGLVKFGIIEICNFAEYATWIEASETERKTKVHDIRAAQREICQSRADTIHLTAIADELYQDPANRHPNVPGHFSAKGIEILGATAGKAFADALSDQ